MHLRETKSQLWEIVTVVKAAIVRGWGLWNSKKVAFTINVMCKCDNFAITSHSFEKSHSCERKVQLWNVAILRN